MKKDHKRPIFIDTFAGCGGLSLGLLRAGWRGLFAIEKDELAFSTLSTNLIAPKSRYRYDWPVWLEQKPWAIEGIMKSHASELHRLRGKVDLLAGGPPCQGFSSAGRRRVEDPRNQLVRRYLEFVEILRPKMVLIENVRGITFDFIGSSHIEKRRNFADELGEGLHKHYHVYTDTIRCSEYGIPQQRPRFFLIGILKAGMRKLVDGDDPFTRLRSSRDSFLIKRGIRAHVTCRQAISDLESGYANIGPSPDTEGYECLLTKAPRTAFQRLMRDGFDGPVPDTRLAQHRAHIVERFRKIIAECHKTGRLGVQLNQSMRERYGINKMATRVLDPASVAPTITSMPDDLLHYLEPRTLTVRENARLQSFPDWFAFQGKYTSGGKRRAKEVPRFTQVANAVPPLIAEMWGEILLSYASSLRKPSKVRLAA